MHLRRMETVSTLSEMVFMISSKRLRMSILQSPKLLTKQHSALHQAKELVLVAETALLMLSAELEATLIRNQELRVLTEGQDHRKEI